MNRRPVILSFLFTLFFTHCFSQSFETADKFFKRSGACKNRDSAIFYGEMAVKAIRNDSLNAHVSLIYNNLGSLYAARGDYVHALNYFGKVKDIAILFQDKNLLAKVSINIANIYLVQGKYESAIQNYLGGLKVIEQTKDTAVLTTGYVCVALAYYYLKDYPRSLEYYKKCLQLFSAQNAKRSMAYCYNTMGIIYKETGDYEKARKYLSDAYLIALNYNDSIMLGSSLTSLGELYSSEGNYDEALRYLSRGVIIQLRLHDAKAVADSKIIIGNVYLRQKKYDLAFAAFDTALQHGRLIGVREIIKDASKGLSDVCAATGKYKESLDYLQLYNNEKDSLFDENSSRQIADMETKYESDKKENENALLVKKNKIKTLEIDVQKDERNALIFSIALIILIAGLFYNRVRLRQRNKLLEEKELRSRAVFKAHEQEKIRISKELHDGLGPVLSLIKMNISGIEKNGDEKSNETAAIIKELTNEGIREVRAISNSLMPSLLDKQGLIPALKDFAEQVNSGGQIKFELITDLKTILPAEKEINIYRIIQEAINNIIKHSGADNAEINLTEMEKFISLSIRDNGKGFHEAALSGIKGNGLNNIYSRADFLKAEISINGKANPGTILVLQIPF